MRTEILSEQEVLVLISALERAPVRDEFIIRLMLQCGLRAGEVQRLMTSDIYTANQTNNAIKLTAATTKNHRSRIIDMPAPVRACADRYKTFMIDMKLFNNEPMPLFINLKTKKPLSIRQIQYIVETHSVYALHRKIHPHVLRHTYATMLLKYTNIRVVQQLLGHSSLQSTQIYTHPNSEDCKKAVESTFDK